MDQRIVGKDRSCFSSLSKTTTKCYLQTLKSINPVFSYICAKNKCRKRKNLDKLFCQDEKADTLKAAIGLENRYRHTNPLNKGRNCQSRPVIHHYRKVHALDSMRSHLLPEGGTEHTSTAPANSGNRSSISTIVHIIRTKSVQGNTNQSQ